MAAFSSAARPVGMTAVSTVVGLLSMAAVSLNPLRVFGCSALLRSSSRRCSRSHCFRHCSRSRNRTSAGKATLHSPRRTPRNVGAALADRLGESAARGCLRSPGRGVRCRDHAPSRRR